MDSKSSAFFHGLFREQLERKRDVEAKWGGGQKSKALQGGSKTKVPQGSRKAQ